MTHRTMTTTWTRATTLALAVTTLAATVLGACDRSEDDAVRPAAANALAANTLATSPVAMPTLKIPTERQEQRFVDAMMDAARLGDAASANALIDWKTLCLRAARDLYAPQMLLDGIVNGATQGCTSSGVCASIANVGQGKAKLKYLGPVTIDGNRWLTFRHMPSGGGFDHLRFLVSVSDEGVARAVDVFVLSLGEASSGTMRRALLPMLVSNPDHTVRRLQGTESAFAKHGAEISEAQQLATAGKPNEALAILNKLPATLANDRFVLAQRVTISRMSGDEQVYLAAIDQLVARHPRDPVTVLNQLDSYALRGRFVDALAVVDRIEAMVTPDAYLDVLRANLQVQANLALDASVSAQRAITREPELIEAYWALIAASLQQPNYADTTRALLALHKNFGAAITLEGMPQYAGYVASPEYAKLTAALATP